MKVYIVECSSMLYRQEQSSYIVDVFDSKEKAIEYIKNNAQPNPEPQKYEDRVDFNRNSENPDFYSRLSIDEWEVK